jgi:hypothetical protein
MNRAKCLNAESACGSAFFVSRRGFEIMKNQPHQQPACRSGFLAVVIGAVTVAAPVVAQPRQTAPPAARAGAAAANTANVAAKPPLDDLDDNRLMGELANRGMNGLLDYYFQKNNVPVQKQQEIRVLIALQHLDGPEFARKNAAERKAEIDDIVRGINAILPQINDTERLQRYAASLIRYGTLRQVNILAYWGESPKTQAALNPIAETVDKVLERAIAEAQKKANAILALNGGNPNPGQMAQWEKVDNLQHLAEFTRANADFGLALSYDKAATEKRTAVCKRGIELLKQFDDEGSSVRVQSQLGIAKLSMLMNTPEAYKQAGEYFAKVIENKDAKFVALQYEARYFTLVADILAKKPEEAEKGLEELKKWQSENMPKDAATQKGIDAALSMLEYRLHAAKADATHEAKQKEDETALANGIMLELVTKRPDLKQDIMEQVVSRLADNPKIDARLNALELEAIVTRGIEAVKRAKPDKDDARSIQLAADAAREIVKRKGQGGITPDQVDNAAFEIGVFEQFIGQSPQLTPEEQRQNRIDAVTAYLEYVEKLGANKGRLDEAMGSAMVLLYALRGADGNDPTINALYDRGLATALNRGQTNVMYYYALRRRELGDFAAAEKAFGIVKLKDQPLIMVRAKYYQIACDQELLRKAADADRPALAARIQKLCDELRGMIDTAMPKATGKDQTALLGLRANAIMAAAEVALAQKQPQRVLDVLKDFEGQVQGLPAGIQQELHGRALFFRSNALMALGRNAESIKAVQDLVETKKPDESLAIVASLLEKLNENFKAERAKDNPDAPTLQVLSAQRAQLAELLVAQVNKDPNGPASNRRQALSFYASSLVEASKQEHDSAKRSGYLSKAIAQYEELVKGVDPNSSDAASLQRLIAFAQIEVGGNENLQKAHDTLNDLFADGKFGNPMIRVGDESKMNDVFWEGFLRFLQVKARLGEATNNPAMVEDARRILKNYIIQFGDNTGGPNYAREFAALRKELIGDWKPPASQPATAPATAPVAAGGR